MSKTRMGKRVASLLLSLVMMLSLLPTAAYATMADGVDTQGAIVSENGTDVSDDSNSSGNTDDLQVGDSKDSGDTGAQQVGGSSGSGTADDTTGAEGGADPTDSVNGNDSADPQDDGDAVLPTAANVARVGGTEYATLEAAIAELSGSSYTLELLDESAWDVATPVYWAAGSESGYAATLADALTAAYMANASGITIVCRPGMDVGKLTHGHVADNITIYGNNAYISSGECDLEVDTYMFSRDTGKQVTTGGAYLDKDITVTAYELDNLGVWGQRNTDHKVTVNLTDCDSTTGITAQRVYISGTTGVNDITLTGCDFGTKATSVYSNADGAVVIDNCSFTGAQVPVNFNHKANGTQTVAVQNSTFTNCGDNGDWKQFAAPVRFVNSGSGTMNTTVNTCTFTDTVGSNGDILLGDGRVDQNSNDVALTVENTAANVQAQQPGYYAKNGTTDESKQGTKTVAAGETLTTSVTQLMPSDTTTSVAEVKGVKYDSLQAAIDAAAKNATVTLLADTRENVTINTYGLTLDLNGHTLNGGTVAGKPALTVTNRVTVKDSSPAQTGTIMREDTAENSGDGSHYVIDIQGQNTFLKFEGGTVKNNSGNTQGKGASLVRVGDDSVSAWPQLTIAGGTFTQDNFIVIKVDRGTFYLTGGTLNSTDSYAIEDWHRATIKGGTVNGTVAVWTYSGGHNSDLTIKGGTVNGNVASVSYDKAEGKLAKVSISGGTVDGTLGTYTYGNGLIPIDDATKATIAVTGGTFSSDPTQYVVEDSGVTKNDDGTYGVAKAYLAQVGETSYYTMDEAFKAQTASGKDIVLLRDYTTGSTFNSGTVKRTVDLNGHTWTCTGTDANSAAFEINYPDASLTVKNGKVVSSQLVGLIPSAMGGTIKYDNSSLVFDGVDMTTTARSGIETNGNNTNDTVTLRNSTLNVPNGFGIYFPSSGTLTIDNSKINAKTMGVQVCSGSLNISGAGTAITVSGDGIDKTINDGAIEDGAAISIVNRIGYKGLDEIKVEGGTFTANGTNAAVKAYDWDNTNKTESDFTQAAKVSVSGGTFSSEVDKSLCAEGYIPTQNEDGTYGVKEETRGTEARPYTLAELGVMTRAEYVAAQEALGGTMYVAVGNYTYDKNGVLGNGERNDTPGQNPDHSKLNAYGENGYLNEKNDGANGKNIVFVNGSITSGATGYTSIDDIGTSLLLAVPAYTNVTFKGITFNNVMSFNYQLYTSPWSQLGELKFDGCMFNGIIVGAIAAQTLTFNSCTFTNYTNTTSANSSNPTWIRPAYGNWTAGDNKGQGDNFRSLTKINFTGNTVTSTRPVKFEYISQWDIRSTVTVTNNSFDISAQEGDTEIKNVGLYLGAHTKTNAFDLVADGNTKSDNTAALYTIPKGETSLPLGSTVTNTNGDQIELVDALKWKAADAEQDKIVLKTVKAVASVDTVNFATLAEAIGAAQDGQTVTLLADATEDVVISKSITLDLGGKTLTNTNVGKATISVTGGTVTVKNGNVVGGNDYYNIEVTKGSNANLTLTDVTATAGNTGSSMIDNYGTLTITSGTYTGGLDTVKNESSAKLNITGGTFTLTKGNSDGFTGVVFNYGELTISGGEFVQSDKNAPYGQAQVIHTDKDKNGSAAPSTVITGGTFKNLCTRTTAWTVRATNAADGATKVSGGAFNKSVKDYYCADGFIPTKNADGTYGVKVGKYVAEVGSKKYETLADAIRLTAKGKTITLLCDVADCGSLTISKNITLDGGGHTISGNSSISVNMPGNAAADVTIKNVNFKDIANGNKLSAFYFSQVKGKLTITGCTFDSIEYEAIQVTPMEGAEVNVSSNVFKAKADGTQVRHIHIEMAYGSGFDCEGQNIKLTVTDNQLHGTVSGDASMGIWWVGTDSTLKVDGNYMEHPETVSITLSNGGVHYNRGDLIYPARSQADVDVDDLMPAVIVAEKASGESKIKAYNTLAEAVAAAQNGQTVTLLADVEQNAQLAIDKSITLDLNGKTIKNTADIWGDNANAILSIRNGAKVTITGNGTIAAKENDCYTINVVNGDLTIENGTFVGNISVVQVQKGSLTINGGAFSLLQKWEGGSKYLINCIDNAYVDGSATVAISGGTFVGFDPNVSPEKKVDGKAPSFAAPGAGITRNEDGSFTAAAGMTAQILDKDGNSVKAYRTLAEAVAAAQDGQTVRLLADVTLDAQIATGKAITIDGQSKYTIKAAKKLAGTDGKAGMFYRTQSANGTLTFLNVTLDGNGVSKIFLNEGGAGETVFDGVTSTNGGGIAYGSGIHISGGGSHATIRNSTLTGSTGTMELNNANYYAANDLWVGGNVYVTVENSVIGNVFVNSAPSATATNGVVHGQLTITGENTKITYLSGEEEAADKLDKFGNNGSLVKIDSGYVEKVFDKGSYAISGGTFKTKVEKEWCAAGYVPTQNGDGTYGVAVGKFTVMVTSRTTGSNSPVANVTGGGSNITYAQGTKVTASAISGYNFVGWFVNDYTGTPYSTDLTCVVKPTDDCTMIAVYEPISGGVFALEVSASKFTVNGGATQRSYLLEKMPVGTQVTVVFKGSENFLYWVNESGKVVSTSKTYTFSMGSATTLKAVYAEKEEHQAMVVFISHTQQVISSKGYTDTQEIQFPEPPIKMGATFVRWSMTESEIRAAMATTTTGIIVVEPVYEFSAGSYTVTVNYPNDKTATYTATVGKITTVTAKSIDGKVFKCWKNGDTVLGYTETLKVAPRGDLTLSAEYVDAGTTVDRLPVIALTEISASQQGAKYAVSFTATRSVPDGYTVTEQGVLVSTDSRYGEAGALDAMKLDADGDEPDNTKSLKATNTDATGVTVLNGIVSAADRTVYGRAYMILRDSSGAMVYVYSDTILSGSYNSLTTNGGN